MIDEMTERLQELLPAAMDLMMEQIGNREAAIRDVFYAYAVVSDKRSLLLEQRARFEETSQGATALIEKRLEGLALVQEEYKRRTITAQDQVNAAMSITRGDLPENLNPEVIDAEIAVTTGDEPKESQQGVGEVSASPGEAPPDGARQPLSFEGGEGPYAVPDEDGGEKSEEGQ